jgi:hypothetical protein
MVNSVLLNTSQAATHEKNAGCITYMLHLIPEVLHTYMLHLIPPACTHLSFRDNNVCTA